ncbi:hypothetical protein Trydic_g11512 [Trypoxylus dichotomus]
MALASFLNIEDAVNRAPCLSMERVLHRHAVNPTPTGWIVSTLSNRTVHVSMNLCNTRTTATAGCPQGGLLSPLLWCLLADHLLPDLREAGFYAQGYVMVTGRFEGVVSESCSQARRST